jgi:hypothetical protein
VDGRWWMVDGRAGLIVCDMAGRGNACNAMQRIGSGSGSGSGNDIVAQDRIRLLFVADVLDGLRRAMARQGNTPYAPSQVDASTREAIDYLAAVRSVTNSNIQRCV